MTTSTGSAARTGLPSSTSSALATYEPPRRDFLRHLAALPLVGGAVALLGSAAAEADPASFEAIEAYRMWLRNELYYLTWESAGKPDHLAEWRPCKDFDEWTQRDRARWLFGRYGEVGNVINFHGRKKPLPSTRAEFVLNAVGCDWHGGRRFF